LIEDIFLITGMWWTSSNDTKNNQVTVLIFVRRVWPTKLSAGGGLVQSACSRGRWMQVGQ